MAGYNVIDIDNDRTMLGCDVPTLNEGLTWLRYYRKTYAPGKPYPNGKGKYNGHYVLGFTPDNVSYLLVQ